MTDKTTISLEINIENLTDKERETLMRLVEKSSGKSDERYPKPELRKRYWYINAEGSPTEAHWYEAMFDKNCYALHNCYLSKEDAEFEAERQKVIAELKNYSFEPDWGSKKEKWYFYYAHGWDCLKLANRSGCEDMCCVYFKTKEIINIAIEAVGEDRIKKYIFGVE